MIASIVIAVACGLIAAGLILRDSLKQRRTLAELRAASDARQAELAELRGDIDAGLQRLIEERRRGRGDDR